MSTELETDTRSAGQAAPPPIRPSLVAASVLAALGMGWLILGLLVLPQGTGWGYDFGAYRDAVVRLWASGDLYQVETVSAPFRPGPYGLYMYPPPAGTAISPLASLAPRDGAFVWHGLHIVALVLACAVMPVSLTIRLATFGVAAFSQAVTLDISLGNVSSTLLLPMALAWRWLDRPAGAIAQALAICVRPTLGIVVIWQALRRRWRAVAWTIGTGVVIAALTLPVVGLDDYVDYLAVLRNISDTVGVERNLDLGSTAVRLGMDQSLGGIALLAGYAVAIGAVLLSLRRDPEVGFMVAVGSSLLLAPVLWDHYLALLVLPAAMLAARGHPWALVLPMLTWLPGLAQPFLAVLATGLPFLAHQPGTLPADSDGRPSRQRPGTPQRT